MVWCRRGPVSSDQHRDQRDHFALVAAVDAKVFHEASAHRIAHIPAAPGNNFFNNLRATLLVTHQLTAFQKAKKLFSSESLGDSCLPELLSEMQELEHPGEKRTRLFSMLLLRCLPAEVCLQLPEDDHEDIHALADKADRC